MEIGRRSFLSTIGGIGLAALAGCTGSSDSTVEVVENEFDGSLEVGDHEIENGQVLGTDAIIANGTITNTSEDLIEATMGAEFFDSDDIILGEDEPSYSGTEIEPDESHQYEQVIEGDADDVDHVELRIVEP